MGWGGKKWLGFTYLTPSKTVLERVGGDLVFIVLGVIALVCKVAHDLVGPLVIKTLRVCCNLGDDVEKLAYSGSLVSIVTK